MAVYDRWEGALGPQAGHLAAPKGAAAQMKQKLVHDLDILAVLPPSP